MDIPIHDKIENSDFDSFLLPGPSVQGHTFFMKYYISLIVCLSFSTFAKGLDLMTVAEKSGWVETGRAAETARLCHDFQRQYPQRVKCRIYGTTPEGRQLHALVVGDLHRPVVWVQAGIHAGEIDGKDAVFWLLRESLEGKLKPNPLDGLALVFVPIVNLDGHERFGKWNRPNQIGPAEMGWRTTAQNLNMNRDFTKAEAPEMQALIKLWSEVDPLVSLDLHVTDGAQFRPEVGLIILPNKSHGTSTLHQAGSELEAGMIEQMKARGRLALPFYPSFEDEANPFSGFSRYVATPRFSQSYWFNRNRLGMLVETHSWKNYANRVLTHRDTVRSVLELTKLHAKSWLRAIQEADHVSLAGQETDLEFKHTEKFQMIDFEGYKFTIQKSKISTGDFIRYFPNLPETWKVPFFEELAPTLTVKAPTEGYFVSTAHAAWIEPKLKVHGIRYEKLKQSRSAEVQTFRAKQTTFSAAPFEGRQTLTVLGEWSSESRLLERGMLFVPIKQKNPRLIMQLFEPAAKDSFLAWGFFNASFEQKEYMEDYVVEDVAEEMMKDEKTKAEFNARVEADAAFAKDPAQRRQFFYRKHSSWDERFNLYPVYKQ